MLQHTNLYEEVKRRLEELYGVKEEKEKRLQQNFKDFTGRIHVANSAGRVQFYLRSSSRGVHEKYLSLQKDRAKIQGYLQKQYDEKVLKQVNKEICSLERLLGSEIDYSGKLKDIYSNNPIAVKQFIKPVDYSDDDFVIQWLACPYEHKKISEDCPYYLSEQGERVRSKSELNIANALYKYGIPYKYECPLVFRNGNRIYPDFTVLVKKKRKEMYWEHRGMMDDRDYIKHSVTRIKEYIVNDFVQGRDFVITEETSLNSLGTNEIDKIIRNHFI